MRRHVLCLLVFLLAVALAAVAAPAAGADTIKAGGNVINETWTAAGSPYIVQGDLTVPVGSTLTIQAGTVIKAVNGDSQAAGHDVAKTPPPATVAARPARPRSSPRPTAAAARPAAPAGHPWAACSARSPCC